VNFEAAYNPEAALDTLQCTLKFNRSLPSAPQFGLDIRTSKGGKSLLQRSALGRVESERQLRLLLGQLQRIEDVAWQRVARSSDSGTTSPYQDHNQQDRGESPGWHQDCGSVCRHYAGHALECAQDGRQSHLALLLLSQSSQHALLTSGARLG
jgi:hypothetical protein